MISTEELARIAVDVVAATAATVRVARRRGVVDPAGLDAVATATIAEGLTRPDLDGLLVVRGAEGERDGVPPLTTPSTREPTFAVYCDPIDGSTCAAHDEPRSVAVIAIAPDRDRGPALPDAAAVCGLGSRTIDATGAFDDPMALRAALTRVFADADSGLLGTLNRVDNRRLLAEHGMGPATGWGSERHATVSLDGERWFAAGNTTVLLPLEVDTEIGRMGLVEAQIQSAMWRSWSGTIVSRDLLQHYPGGTTAYLEELLRARDDPEDAFERLFSPREQALYRSAGWDPASVLRPLSTRTFGPGEGALVAIAGITASTDAALTAKRTTLAAASSAPDGTHRVHTLLVHDGRVRAASRPEHAAARTEGAPR